MKLVVVILILSIASTVRAVDSSTASSGQNQNAHYHEAAKEYARLAVNLAKTKYWNRHGGFTVPPMKIYDEFGFTAEKGTSRMQQLDAEHPLLWKGVAFEIGDLYAEYQTVINDKRVKHAKAIRRDVSKALEYACSARGGGSASMVLNAIAPAQTEWLIKRMTVGGRHPISDKKFLSTLAFHITDYNPNDLHQALVALKKADSLITSNEKAHIRHDFLAYFAEHSYRTRQ